MNKNIEIKWWSHSSHKLSDEQESVLLELGLERVATMTAQGYREGELHSGFITDGGGEVEYKGWWKLRDKKE